MTLTQAGQPSTAPAVAGRFTVGDVVVVYDVHTGGLADLTAVRVAAAGPQLLGQPGSTTVQFDAPPADLFRVLGPIGLRAADVRAILLVGESDRFAAVAAMLAQELPCPILVDGLPFPPPQASEPAPAAATRLHPDIDLHTRRAGPAPRREVPKGQRRAPRPRRRPVALIVSTCVLLLAVAALTTWMLRPVTDGPAAGGSVAAAAPGPATASAAPASPPAAAAPTRAVPTVPAGRTPSPEELRKILVDRRSGRPAAASASGSASGSGSSTNRRPAPTATSRTVVRTPAAGTDTHLVIPVTGTGTLVSNSTGRCLDVADGQVAAGSAVQSFSCNGTAAQVWTATGATLRSGDLCLETSDPGAGQSGLTLAACDGSAAQIWVIDGPAVRQDPTGHCLAVQPAAADTQVPAVAAACTAASDQSWTLS